jgi:HAD superfamily hydrolase (TIGR01509 family)
MTSGYGVLFDVDGTLVDTTYVHTVCWTDALRGGGHDVPMATVHHAIGMGSAELLDHLLGSHRDHDADAEMIDAHRALYRQYWGRLAPLPGARELLGECARRGLAVVLASSAAQDELDVLRAALDADDVVTTATSSSDAGAGKPDPDILQAALDQSGLSADRVVFVGDAVWDGASAGKAGVRFIAVTCGGTPEGDLRDAGAMEVWRDPAALLEAFDRSVLASLG